MSEYNVQDPHDVDIMRGSFDIFTADDWEEYAEYAEEYEMGFKSVKILRSAAKKAGMAKYVSPKVLKWVLRLVEELDEKLEAEEEGK